MFGGNYTYASVACVGGENGQTRPTFSAYGGGEWVGNKIIKNGERWVREV